MLQQCNMQDILPYLTPLYRIPQVLLKRKTNVHFASGPAYRTMDPVAMTLNSPRTPAWHSEKTLDKSALEYCRLFREYFEIAQACSASVGVDTAVIN